MIPVTSFAGRTVAVFGLGGSGLASCHALRAGGAEVIAGDDGADRLAEAARCRYSSTADLRTASTGRKFRGAGADAGRAAHPSRPALDAC